MGNLESLLPERRSLQELRRENRQSFAAAIASLRSEAPEAGGRGESPQPGDEDLLVCVRKRPLSEWELQRDEFDVVSAGGSEVRVHRCLARLDGQRLYLETKAFRCARAFDEHASNREVCGALRAILVPQSDQPSVVILFGATGSGETNS